MPADGVLEAGDEVLRVNGTKVESAADVVKVAAVGKPFSC